MSIKRHWMTIDGSTLTASQWHSVVLATDYDSLATRAAALEECLREMIRSGDIRMGYTEQWERATDKAISLLAAKD